MFQYRTTHFVLKKFGVGRLPVQSSDLNPFCSPRKESEGDGKQTHIVKSKSVTDSRD